MLHFMIANHKQQSLHIEFPLVNTFNYKRLLKYYVFLAPFCIIEFRKQILA